WFEPIRPVRLDEKVFTLLVPNKFFYEWLEEHYIGLLKSTIRQEVGEKVRLEYQILVNDNSENNQPQPNKPVETKETPDFSNANDIKNPFVIPGIKKWSLEAKLNSMYNFGNYIEGDCNRLA
ncbi:MAG: chromosomal replication initiator protein DnaA, partial [Saprospiraceae bacterium]|nr:chromosomal replication initiator protein DnaA [Saprospiraceae bacterium]